MSTPLATLQREFLRALFDDRPAERPGLAAYRRGVSANLAGALAAAYPVTRRLVGEAFFAEAAARFARAEPSRSGDLHGYGGGFADFLAAYAPARPVAPLADVARLEWAVHECRHAGDGAVLDAGALAALGPDRVGTVRLRLHPAARLARSAHPVLAIWEANQPGRDGTPAGPGGAQQVLVHRRDLEPAASPLDGIEWAIAAAFRDGATLEEAADAAGDAPEGAFAASLARLATLGAFDGFEAPRG